MEGQAPSCPDVLAGALNWTEEIIVLLLRLLGKMELAPPVSYSFSNSSSISNRFFVRTTEVFSTNREVPSQVSYPPSLC